MMRTLFATAMIVAGGLFAGSVVSFAWSRVPIWRHMPVERFAPDFAATIRFADKIQPALLIVTITSALALCIETDGAPRALSAMAAGVFTIVLVASVAVLVPLQRRMIAAAAASDAAFVEEMRPRWFRGHIGRAALSTVGLVTLAVAAVISQASPSGGSQLDPQVDLVTGEGPGRRPGPSPCGVRAYRVANRTCA